MSLIAAKCPNCGADIQLDDTRETGFCMYCGTTVIVKEAIQTVKIDNTKNIENYKRIADTSFDAGNYADAYNYYSKILEENFDNWYAIYRRGLCSAWQSNLANPRINELLSVITNALQILTKSEANFKSLLKEPIEGVSEELLNELSEGASAVSLAKNMMAKDICVFSNSFYTLSYNHFKEFINLYKSGNEFYTRSLMILELVDFAYDLADDNNVKETSVGLGKIISHAIASEYSYVSGRKWSEWWGRYENVISTHSMSYSQKEQMKKLLTKWGDTAFLETLAQKENVKSGCYIATAVYGSYDAPKVLLLRKFRDNVLAHSVFGRIFIKIYYTISPPVANKLKYAKRINKIVKNLLDHFVIWINNKNI